MSGRPDDPTVRLAAVALIARARRMPPAVVGFVVARYGRASTAEIVDEAARDVPQHLVIEPIVDCILAAEREMRRRRRLERGVA